MKTKRTPQNTDIHLWKWSHKAMMPDGTTVTFNGTFEAPYDQGSKAAGVVEQSLRKKHPDAKWMGGPGRRTVEGARNGLKVRYGLTYQRGKFLRSVISPPKTVPVSELSTLKMVAGGEKKHSVVIHDGEVKRWVGIGWITERKATEEDLKDYPVAI